MSRRLTSILAVSLTVASALAQPVIVQQPAPQAATNGGAATFTVVAAGTGPFMYQWQCNGTNLPNGIITTVAGATQNPGYSGDSGPAISAELNYPSGVAVDGSGNIFVADTGNSRIRAFAPGGTISTVAGNGSQGFSGDGGIPTSASVHYPFGVAVDGNGNVYIADTYNQRIRAVLYGTMATVAGNGTAGFSGDGGQSENAMLNNPSGVAVDAGENVYIADSGNNRIRKVAPGGIIMTFAGDSGKGFFGDGNSATNAELNNPLGVAVDNTGDLIIADSGNNRVRMVGTNGKITTIAGNGTAAYSGDGGAATNASLSNPCGVAADGWGNLFILDLGNRRIREVNTNGIITTVAGTGVYANDAGTGDGGLATNAQFSFDTYDVDIFSCGLAADRSGNLYVTDSGWGGGSRIRQINLAGLPTLTVTNISAGNLGNYQVIVSGPSGSVTSSVATLAFAPLVTPPLTNQTVWLGGSATFTATVAGVPPFNYQWILNGTSIPGATNASYTVTGASTNDSGAYAVTVTNSYGSTVSASATLNVVTISQQPSLQAVLNNGTAAFSVGVSIPGAYTYQWVYNGTNLPPAITSVATNIALSSPDSVAIDSCGNLFICDAGNRRIREMSTSGGVTTVAGDGGSGYSGDGGAATNATISGPVAVAVDLADNLYISDQSDNRIREVGTDGIINTLAGTGGSFYSGDGGPAVDAGLYTPGGIAVDASGDVFIADMNSYRIRKVNLNGIISTVAGNGISSYSGDGGNATNAGFYPQNVAVDLAGNLFITCQYAERIRKVSTNGIISTFAGNGSSGFAGDGSAATSARLYSPGGVAVDAIGDVFIADSGNNRIREVGANGLIMTVAGSGATGFSGDGGAATNAALDNPADVALDRLGNLYIADAGNNRVREVNFAGSPVLPMGKATAKNAGNYQVIITSSFGSITSSVAPLVIITRPVISQLVNHPDGSTTLNLLTSTNASSRLYSATNLIPPVVWQPIDTNAIGGTWQFTDTNAMAGSRFYLLSTP